MAKKHLFSLTKKDFEINTFRSGGKGGQHQNVTDSGVRIIHKDSGAVGECRDGRSQHANKKLAFRRLTSSPKFRLWLNKKVYEVVSNETIEEKVEKMMDSKNLKIERMDDNGKWIEYEDESIENMDSGN